MRKSAAFQLAQSNTWAFAQVLSPLLAKRLWCVWIAVASVTHLALANSSQTNLGCALQSLTGLRCPGCGLTTALLDLLHGRWIAAIAHHAFVPVFFFALILITLAAVLPERWRQQLVTAVGSFEQRTGIMPLIACALVVYGCFRTL
jgi:hypothetical protein